MDYSICHAIAQFPGIVALLICYDIACQWFKNFNTRLQQGAPYLALPKDLLLSNIIPAVGKFHLGAHILKCFVHFSLVFIQGSGQNDGEVMERLWSVLNKAANPTRGMSTAFRRETLDWHMNFSNWTKCIASRECVNGLEYMDPNLSHLGRDLIRRYRTADVQEKTMLDAFRTVQAGTSFEDEQEWLKLEATAISDRGEALKIYQVEAQTGT